MESGDQDLTVQGGTNLFAPIFESKGLNMVPVIREDDRIKYKMVGSNRGAIERIINAPKDDYGLAVFPEGTVQGGRSGKDGNINGMQKVEGGGILLRCISFWENQGNKSVLLPVGIINSYQIFKPDTYEISEKAFGMVSGAIPLEKVVKVAIGTPITEEDAEKELGVPLDGKSQEHIDYLMGKIANLLPKEARGYYR